MSMKKGAPLFPSPFMSPARPRCRRSVKRKVALHECPAGRACESNTAGANFFKSEVVHRFPWKEVYALKRSPNETEMGELPRRYVIAVLVVVMTFEVPPPGFLNSVPEGAVSRILETNDSKFIFPPTVNRMLGKSWASIYADIVDQFATVCNLDSSRPSATGQGLPESTQSRKTGSFSRNGGYLSSQSFLQNTCTRNLSSTDNGGTSGQPSSFNWPVDFQRSSIFGSKWDALCSSRHDSGI